MAKPRKEPEYEIRYIESFGDVGAGTVVPFTPKNDMIPVAIPAGGPSDDKLGTMVVRGRSLEDEGIYDGDVLICRRDFVKRDVKPDTICVVFIRSTGDLVAKKVIEEYGKITLRSSGGGIKDAYYEKDDIEVRGIVFGFQRLKNEFGRFTKPSDSDIPF